MITAAKKLVTSRDIRDGTIKTKDLSRRARAQLRGAKGTAGARGATGSQGAPGLKGTPGTPGTPGQDGTDATINGVGAGGHLSGTYPNPSIAPGAVTPDAFSGSGFPTARARSTVNQVVTNATAPLVRLQTNVHLRGITHNTGTTDSQTCGTGDTVPGDCFLTVTRSGTYLITGSATWAFNASGMRQIEINGWTANVGTAFLLARDSRNPVQATGFVASPETAQSVSTVRQLTTGQSVSLTAYQDSGSGLSVFGGADSVGPATLSVTWLGPGA